MKNIENKGLYETASVIWISDSNGKCHRSFDDTFIHASDNSLTVEREVQINGSHFIIKVKDDGKGIENLDKIWSRFSKGEDGNFGLGLSIAKTSVEMMNGEVKASNDGGAVFEIRLDLL